METTAKKYEIRATSTNSDFESVQVRNAEDAATFAKQFYFDDIAIYESAFIMLLNRAHKVMGWAKISQGGTASTVLDKKIICKYAIDTLAEAVILIHNHPSDQHGRQQHDDGNKKRPRYFRRPIARPYHFDAVRGLFQLSGQLHDIARPHSMDLPGSEPPAGSK